MAEHNRSNGKLEENHNSIDNNNETSYTFMANNTPPEREDNAATDPLNDMVQTMLDSWSGMDDNQKDPE